VSTKTKENNNETKRAETKLNRTKQKDRNARRESELNPFILTTVCFIYPMKDVVVLSPHLGHFSFLPDVRHVDR